MKNGDLRSTQTEPGEAFRRKATQQMSAVYLDKRETDVHKPSGPRRVLSSSLARLDVSIGHLPAVVPAVLSNDREPWGICGGRGLRGHTL